MNSRYDFASDNTAPVAPEAMAALTAANHGHMASYGDDVVTAQAAELIRGLLDADAQVYFLPSGTAANSVCLATLCRPFEAVLAHNQAHVAIDETGAPGLFGHGLGIIGLAGESGLIDPTALDAALSGSDNPHHQSPAALSLTNASEYGTVYSALALGKLTKAAKAKGLGVHLDGARLANAAAAGFDLAAIKGLGVDLLVFGGAKAGMTPTEAIVIFDPKLAGRFGARLKQSGQLPSKGRYYAAPFVGMLRDGAILRHAAQANAMAAKLAALSPFPLRHSVQANMVFIDMDAPTLARLHKAGWLIHRVFDGSVRLVCSWATTPEAVEEMATAMTAAKG